MGKDLELISAVKRADSALVRKLLYRHRKSSAKKSSSKKNYVVIQDAEGFTSLHHASLLGDVEIIMAVIEMGGDANAQDKKGMSPLHLAAWAGKEESVKCLLENHSLPNMPSFNGDTPLHLAAQHGYSAVTKMLLNAGSDGTILNNSLETPLYLSCQYGHTAVVKQLLMNTAIVSSLQAPTLNVSHKSALHAAARAGHADIVALLLQSGVNINEEKIDGTALHVAAVYGKKLVVKMLIQAGADIYRLDKNGLTPLNAVNKFTASRASLEIKQMLREAAGESVVYAKAVSDYCNKFDVTCLSFKIGDTVAVLEQNDNGRWKGYVVNDQEERVGYFPAMTVHLLHQKTISKSATSIGSSVDSGVLDRSCSSTPEKYQDSKDQSAAAAQPVGMIPIGQYDVVTLATVSSEANAPPKQTACGSLPPRMSSFKKRVSPPTQDFSRAHGYPQNGGQPLPHAQNHHHQHHHRAASEKAVGGAYGGRNSRESAGSSASAPAENTGYSGVGEPQSNTRQRLLSAGSALHDATPALTKNSGSRSEDGVVNYARLEFPSSRSPAATTPSPTDYTRVFFDADYKAPSARDVISSDCDIASTGGLVAAKNAGEPYAMGGNNSKGSRNNDLGIANTNGSDKRTASESNRYEVLHAYGSDGMLPGMTDGNRNVKGKDLLESEDKSGRVPTSFQDPNFSIKRAKSAPPWKKSSLSGSEQASLPEQNPTLNNNREKYENVSITYPQSELHPRADQVRGNQPSSDLLSRVQPKVAVGSQPPVTQAASEYAAPRNITASLTSPASNRPVSQGSSSSEFEDAPDAANFQRLSRDDQEMLSWLSDLKLTGYREKFKQHGFDMISARGITPEDLNIMGIVKTGHRKKILSEVAKLSPTTRIPCEKPRDVGSWLGALNLRQYETNFIEGGFDDIDFIKDLDRNDLEMIDIKKRGHQTKLLMAVQVLADLELTSILDRAVEDSPVKRTASFHNKSRQLGGGMVSYSPQTVAPFQIPEHSDMADIFTGDLPPPPPFVFDDDGTNGYQEHGNGYHQPGAHGNGLAPALGRAGNGHSTPPRPKPKPSQKQAYVNGDVSENKGSVSMRPPESRAVEEVSSAKSRSFWKQQQGKELSEPRSTSPSPPNTIKRSGSIGVKPLAAPPSPRLVPESEPARSGSLKKMPPPAPPKRTGSVTQSIAPTGTVGAAATHVQSVSLTSSSPLCGQPVAQTKLALSSSETLGMSDRPAVVPTHQAGSRGLSSPRPTVSTSPVGRTSPDGFPPAPLETPNVMHQELKETDAIMADINSMIADFSSELENLF